jgi:hypothetical protein
VVDATVEDIGIEQDRRATGRVTKVFCRERLAAAPGWLRLSRRRTVTFVVPIEDVTGLHDGERAAVGRAPAGGL